MRFLNSFGWDNLAERDKMKIFNSPKQVSLQATTGTTRLLSNCNVKIIGIRYLVAQIGKVSLLTLREQLAYPYKIKFGEN